MFILLFYWFFVFIFLMVGVLMGAVCFVKSSKFYVCSLFVGEEKNKKVSW